MTHEWLNIRYSLEKIFTDFLAQTAPALPFYRFAPPAEPEHQRALVTDRALFAQFVEGDLNRNQDTYGTIYLLRAWDKSKYLPPFAADTWLQAFAGKLMAYLDVANAATQHLFPLYNVVGMLPAGAYEAMLSSGDTSEIAANLPDAPAVVPHTGFFMRGGHAQPTLKLNQNPMLWEMPVVFQHYNYEAWQGTRG